MNKKLTPEGYELVLDVIREAETKLLNKKVNIKPITVKGETIRCEYDLQSMLEADMITSTQYDKYLDKFRTTNASREKLKRDMEEAKELLSEIRVSVMLLNMGANNEQTTGH